MGDLFGKLHSQIRLAIQYRDRVEVHLLLLHEQLEPGTPIDFGQWDALIDQLAEVGVPDDAIRHTYGGTMAVA